jgi:hypothetical protein
MLYLVEVHKLLFVAKTFHVPYINLKINVNCLENVLNLLTLGAKPLHDANQ